MVTSPGSGINPAGEMSILVSETIQLINWLVLIQLHQSGQWAVQGPVGAAWTWKGALLWWRNLHPKDKFVLSL